MKYEILFLYCQLKLEVYHQGFNMGANEGQIKQKVCPLKIVY